MKRNILLRLFTPVTLAVVILGITSCDKNDNVALFSVSNDVELGQQVSAEIASDPSYNIIPESENPEAYAYINAMVDDILNSGELAYRDEFAWEVTLLKDDNTLNAFATPGGYIYVYTGLIKYLETPDALEGVLGHEIAHADLRHTSRNIQKQYGVSLLLNILLGKNASQLKQIAGQVAGTLSGLSFSRDFEEEADAKSVDYLGATDYACNGAAYFFEKLLEEGQAGSTPEFLSTHPSPDSRVEDINALATEAGCDTSLSGKSGYEAFQNSL
ncbi:M48 family metalloprotease [Fulvivirga sediminis]|uniref:M48 family metalloprotease n=1 Tax=Fulvivirga sediminis TaxID=2803949 RepID=A0A937F376_9BACT|nr:M48 family metalloprotease [Fulvivirga sediminis]MBL3655502.1 M48 family metalloprotease [Fulvivirga sediminis]